MLDRFGDEPLAAPLALALGIGSTYQARLVQAQDGSGQQVFATYELEVGSSNLDRVCLGHKTSIPVKVRAHVLVVGGPAAGAVRVLNPRITAESQDFDIASVDVGQDWQGLSPDVPIESTLLVTGVSVGTTTITVEVVGPNTNRFGPASSFRLRKTLRVRVVPCAYRVDVTSFWVTRMYNADVLVSATMVNIPQALSARAFTTTTQVPLVKVGCSGSSRRTASKGVSLETTRSGNKASL
jgi:hypothetical protein